jgi:hypothetical protein
VGEKFKNTLYGSVICPTHARAGKSSKHEEYNFGNKHFCSGDDLNLKLENNL